MFAYAPPPEFPTLEYHQPVNFGVSREAQYIKERFSSEFANRVQTQVFGSGIRSALSELAEIKAECSSANWDGYNSLPLQENSLDYAKKFLGFLPIGVEAPAVSIEPDGEVSFEWYRSASRILSVSFSSLGEIHSAAIIGARRFSLSEPIGDSLPYYITSSIRAITSNS